MWEGAVRLSAQAEREGLAEFYVTQMTAMAAEHSELEAVQQAKHPYQHAQHPH